MGTKKNPENYTYLEHQCQTAEVGECTWWCIAEFQPNKFIFLLEITTWTKDMVQKL